MTPLMIRARIRARIRATVAALAHALALAASGAAAQAPAPTAFAPLTADSSRNGALGTLGAPVTLSLKNATVADAVSAVARQVGLSLTYDPALPGLDRTVSVTVTRAAAAAAILRILDGTPIQAMVSPSGQVVLVSRAPPRRAGVVEGTVRDAATAAPVAGARVELVGTRFSTVSRARGEFSLGVIPVGRYTARITRMGFLPVTVEQLSVPTHADAPPLDVPLEHAPISLAAVVVTPGYFGMMQPSLGVPQTMSRERIETVPQIGEDIYRAVNRLPGVTSTDFSADFFVRGGSSSELYVTLDGLELIEPFHLKDVGGGLSIIDSRAIGGVELTSGGFSAEYGDRLTGVFAMRSVDPSAEGARTSLGLSVLNARLTSQGRFGDGRGAWLLSARRGYLDLALKLANAGDSLDPRYYDVFAKAQYDLGRAGRLAVHLLDAGDALTYLDTPDPSIRSRYRSSYAWLNWEGRAGRLRQQTVASLGRLGWRREGERIASGTLTALVDDRRTMAVAGIRQDWSLELAPRALVKFGADVKDGSAEYDYWSRAGNESVEAGAVVLTWDTTEVRRSPRSTRVGAYVAPRFRPVSSVAVEVGLRYDRASHTGDGLFSPRVNLSWEPRLGTSVRGAWGKYSQSQPLAGLQAQDGVEQFFAAERAEHRVIGIEHALPRGLTGRLEAYDRRLTRQRPRFLSVGPGVEVFPELGWDRVRVDPDRGYARGIELLLSRDQGRRVDWSAGYGLASVTDRIAGRDVPRATDQRHTMTADWAYRPPSNKWRLSLAGVWHSGWPYTPQVARLDTIVDTPTAFGVLPRWEPGELYSGRLPAYRRVDARWTRYFEARNGRFSLFAEVYNLLDMRNRRGYFTNVSVDGRNRAVSFTRGGEDWIPRLPTFGVTYEFGGAGR